MHLAQASEAGSDSTPAHGVDTPHGAAALPEPAPAAWGRPVPKSAAAALGAPGDGQGRHSVATWRECPDAQHALGRCFAKGKGVEQSDAEAARWHRKAAVQGHAAAQFHLGRMLARGGEGVARDDTEAVRWYEEAATPPPPPARGDAEDARARARKGKGAAKRKKNTPRKKKKNTAPSQKVPPATAQGHAGAQFHLGLMLVEGRGVPRPDAEAAAMWHRMAAEQGQAQAQHSLGEMLAAGTGVAVDNTEAVLWLRRAAAQGVVAAARTLLESGGDTGKQTRRTKKKKKKKTTAERPAEPRKPPQRRAPPATPGRQRP